MLKNAHIVIYPINKKNEFNVVCIVRQKLSNSIDLKAIIKRKYSLKIKIWKIYFRTN